MLSHWCTRLGLFSGILILFAASPAPAAELAVLSQDTWAEFVPRGKEVDCIYGDYVLRNERIVAVVAQPVAGRNANMTVRGVGGALIDLTFRRGSNDQLSAYYPGASEMTYTRPDRVKVFVDGQEQSLSQPVSGQVVQLVIEADEKPGLPSTRLRYTLQEGEPYVLIETLLTNEQPQPLTFELRDGLRADRTFEFGHDEQTGVFWACDDWFRQSYGILVDGGSVQPLDEQRLRLLQIQVAGKEQIEIAPGETITAKRMIFPAPHQLALLSTASRIRSVPQRPVEIQVNDATGPVRHARLVLTRGDARYGIARTNARGRARFGLPSGSYRLEVEALGRPTKLLEIDTAEQRQYEVTLEPCGYVVGRITDDNGRPLPCKVAFRGKEGTATPDFGPDSGDIAVKNLHYSHNGEFRQEIAPGKYDVIVSYGPEYDAVFSEIEVRPGQESLLEATLKRSVSTPGWISADFHNHSSPSGDNTSSQLGRVLNLLCEHIEFAPCTEHNRVSTYTPHLRRLNVESLMATCTGMELTHAPGTVNHQNAFPLIRKPHHQDDGAPQADENPLVQIERLALWDNGSEKLVQTNHPDLVQILGDRDQDGQADGGFREMFGFMDVIEVHPPADILKSPAIEAGSSPSKNRIVNWLQLLNLGYRIPGVVNTDAHYNYHGSGGLRNYLRSTTDDPAEIQTLDMVHAAEAGHVIMTNGPYLEVELRGTDGDQAWLAIAGDEVRAAEGAAELQVRVQCANWLDVNRVQVLLNGQAVPELNFTRRTHPDQFQTGTVKFASTIPLNLKEDSHVIVVTAGEGSKLGPVLGPNWGEQMPVAVSNPIFVDVDGNGFQANGDTLGIPLPVEH